MAAANSTKVTAAVLAVGVLGAFGGLNSYEVSSNYAEKFPDAYGGAVAQVRFAPLLERVPAAAELGYFTDLDPGEKASESAFLAAQYAVAPRVLVTMQSSGRLEWAVGNFSRPQDFAAAGAARGYT